MSAWTRQYPTEPGWYWFRRDGVYNPASIPALHMIMFNGQIVETYMMEPLCENGVWQGPIYPVDWHEEVL